MNRKQRKAKLKRAQEHQRVSKTYRKEDQKAQAAYESYVEKPFEQHKAEGNNPPVPEVLKLDPKQIKASFDHFWRFVRFLKVLFSKSKTA